MLLRSWSPITAGSAGSNCKTELSHFMLEAHRPLLPLPVRRTGQRSLVTLYRTSFTDTWSTIVCGNSLCIRPPCVNAETTASTTARTAEEGLSPEEEDQANVKEILRVLDLLEKKRGMPFNEVRLTVMIEDPMEEEQREELDMENERGCSREEMAAALADVYEGKIPSNRVALRELTKEMLSWPNLEGIVDSGERSPSKSPYARATDTGVDPNVVSQQIDWDAAAEIMPVKQPDDIADVPPAVGYSVLYLVTAIPLLIGVVVVATLFLNSFR